MVGIRRNSWIAAMWWACRDVTYLHLEFVYYLEWWFCFHLVFPVGAHQGRSPEILGEAICKMTFGQGLGLKFKFKSKTFVFCFVLMSWDSELWDRVWDWCDHMLVWSAASIWAIWLLVGRKVIKFWGGVYKVCLGYIFWRMAWPASTARGWSRALESNLRSLVREIYAIREFLGQEIKQVIYCVGY